MTDLPHTDLMQLINSGQVTLDANARVAFVADRRVPLTAGECGILQRLLTDPNTVERELSRVVDDADPFRTTIRVPCMTLSRKLLNNNPGDGLSGVRVPLRPVPSRGSGSAFISDPTAL